MKNASKAIESYIFGKDGNRPDLLQHAFSPDATLNVLVQTNTILFPPNVQGREDIAEVLVRSFSLQYESPRQMFISANGWLVCQQKRLESYV